MQRTILSIIVSVLVCWGVGFSSAVGNGEKKDSKTVEIFILNVPAVKSAILKKGIVYLEIENDKPVGVNHEEDMKNITKVDGEIPKAGKAYVYAAKAKWSFIKGNESTLVNINSPEKLKVGTKLRGKYKGQFKADVQGLGGATYTYYEGTPQ